MRRHRRHSIEFKRQMAEAYLADSTLRSLAKQHDVCWPATKSQAEVIHD